MSGHSVNYICRLRLAECFLLLVLCIFCIIRLIEISVSMLGKARLSVIVLQTFQTTKSAYFLAYMFNIRYQTTRLQRKSLFHHSLSLKSIYLNLKFDCR